MTRPLPRRDFPQALAAAGLMWPLAGAAAADGPAETPGPLDRLYLVFRNTGVVPVHAAKRKLGFGEPLFCRLAVPLYGLDLVFLDAGAVAVANTKGTLGSGVPLFCCLAELRGTPELLHL